MTRTLFTSHQRDRPVGFGPTKGWGLTVHPHPFQVLGLSTGCFPLLGEVGSGEGDRSGLTYRIVTACAASDIAAGNRQDRAVLLV